MRRCRELPETPFHTYIVQDDVCTSLVPWKLLYHPGWSGTIVDARDASWMEGNYRGRFGGILSYVFGDEGRVGAGA